MSLVLVRWKDVVGYEGCYRISNTGKVRCIKTSTPKSGKIIKQSDRCGYKRVYLTKEGITKLASVHILVLQAFVGKKPFGMESCHRDGNRANNYINNLRWDTHIGNLRDNQNNGTVVRGEKSHKSKLTEQQVREIRNLYISKTHTQVQLGKIYGVSGQMISDIVRYNFWKHVD